MPVDVADFSHLGLGFDRSTAADLADVFKKGCVVLGFVGGVGLALTGLSDMGKAGRGHGTPKSMALVMLLAGLGVGTAVIGGACQSIKLSIENYLQGFDSTASAVAALTPTKRAELEAEARKLLSLRSKIEEIYSKPESDYYT